MRTVTLNTSSLRGTCRRFRERCIALMPVHDRPSRSPSGGHPVATIAVLDGTLALTVGEDSWDMPYDGSPVRVLLDGPIAEVSTRSGVSQIEAVTADVVDTIGADKSFMATDQRRLRSAGHLLRRRTQPSGPTKSYRDSASQGPTVGVALNALTAQSRATCAAVPESRITFRVDSLSTMTAMTVRSSDVSVVKRAST